MAELLPCPFCGGEAKLKTIVPMSVVVCKTCGSMGKIVADQYEEGDSKEDAIKSWNSRKNKFCDECTRFFGMRLRAERKKRGLSSDYMARKLFMHKATYYYYESGKKRMNDQDIAAVCKLFGIEPKTLLGE